MANIPVRTASEPQIVAAAFRKVEVVESLEQHTAPAAEQILAGSAVRIDPANGRFTNANASAAAEADFYGIATRNVIAGESLTAIKRGVMDGFEFTGDYNSPVYLGNADATLADAPGTVGKRVGRILPGFANVLGTQPDKLLLIEN